MTQALEERAPRSFRWSTLQRGTEGAETSAEDEAREIARALTAHSIVVDPEAVPEEYDDRFGAILQIVWGDDPISGYGLHASLGAYLVAKVAVGMVPAGHTGLRHEPLRASGIENVLVDHGLDRATAQSIIGEFQAVSADFRGSKAGLDPSRLAGLAERTLSREERTAALSQVAYSPRCLSRLAATASLLAATRAILPVLPPKDLGPRLAIAATALALGRADRVLALYGARAEHLALTTFIELATAREQLGRGASLELDDDAFVLAPPLQGSALKPHEADAALEGDGATDILDEAFDTSANRDDEDDVLEIVEERIDPDAGVQSAVTPQSAPRAPRWGATDAPIDEADLERWRDRLVANATLAATRGALLGLKPAPLASTVAPTMLPPDERILRRAAIEDDEEAQEKTERIDLAAILSEQRVTLDGTPYDALYPPVRGLLRAAAAAADGHAPSESALKDAGDLAWAVARIRALALVVRGELAGARDVVAALGDGAAPEGRWAKDRLIRYADEAAEPVPPEHARPAAAALVEDLAQQLCRTMAATVPGYDVETEPSRHG